jgi:hypothetical protein
MTTKEIIRAELDKLNEHDLAELLAWIPTLAD